jgi:hypothetical protein
VIEAFEEHSCVHAMCESASAARLLGPFVQGIDDPSMQLLRLPCQPAIDWIDGFLSVLLYPGGHPPHPASRGTSTWYFYLDFFDALVKGRQHEDARKFNKAAPIMCQPSGAVASLEVHSME